MASKSLLQEAKNFQAIRVLNVFYADNERARDNKISEDLAKKLFERIKKFSEFNFYIDGFFRINEAYYLNRISYQRKKSDDDKILPIDFSKTAISHPLYILFTSAFNEGIDRTFRDAIEVNDGNHNLVPISYYLFNPIRFNASHKLSESELQQKHFALMFFQIGDASLAKHLTNEDKLFEKSLFKSKQGRMSEYEIVAYGIIKGDIEGFILFDIKDSSEKDFLNILKGSGEGSPLGKYHPLTVFFCRWEKQYAATDKFTQLQALSA